MGILDNIAIGNKITNKKSLKGGIENAIQPPGYTKGAQSIVSSLFGAQASEANNSSMQPVQNKLPSQNPDFMSGILGGMGNILGGIGSFASSNPALMQGLLTMGIGAGSGLTGLESAGLGGQAYSNKQAELQRQYEQQQKILASMAGSNINVTDTTKQLENEINLLGLKRPQDRQAYIQKRLAGETPTYNPGILGVGQGVY